MTAWKHAPERIRDLRGTEAARAKSKHHHNEAHTSLVRQIRLDAAAEPDVILWPNSKGTMRGDKYVSLPGLTTGAADLIGMAGGRFLAIEVKTGKGRLTPEQVMFLKLVNKNGGYGCVARCADGARAAMLAAKRGDAAPEIA